MKRWKIETRTCYNLIHEVDADDESEACDVARTLAEQADPDRCTHCVTYVQSSECLTPLEDSE